MKVAIVHEWSKHYAGSERVLESLLGLFPQADLFALVDFVPESDRNFFNGPRMQTSFIQELPFARRQFRKYLGLMPLAVEQFELSGYDLLISSNVVETAMAGRRRTRRALASRNGEGATTSVSSVDPADPRSFVPTSRTVENLSTPA